MKPANLELNLALALEESPRKCLHCGGTAHETIKPDGYLYKLHIFTCDKCTFETHNAHRREEAVERWNNGIDHGMSYGSSCYYHDKKPTDSVTLHDRYGMFPQQIPKLRATNQPIYQVFAFGLGKLVTKGVPA